eukprot:CAMPEP_0198318164 /NCGR_PEP_ID=MMETSP1450-20131203/7532_1 /TAXON_ID=753684 ORGANISM="Madagascaria erythrocladiodes, Strain CCMP3234" /NCGR_SAMPLE_ID=MMETSP1450 /ASSEMBLY_ACC=CAM_ASM_001115 /LENGTH=88 /DNA_ID=CAMNT_0044021439 /DNA_START=51 /DNA_END=313 /DNA_ORIENTATION=+
MPSCDIYAYGLLLWQVATEDSIPFHGVNNSDFEYFTSVVTGKKGKRPSLTFTKQFTSVAWKQLMRDCWQHRPYLRPTAADVLERIKAA